MKKILVIFTSLAIAGNIQAQISSVGMTDGFKQITGYGSRQSGFEGLQTYSNKNVKGSQFFNDTWSTGSITGVNHEVIGNMYLFLYDKVKQDLYIRPKDTAFVVLADKNQISSFTINTDKPHSFFPGSIYDPSLKGNFVEVLVQNGKYSLLKSTITTFVKANHNDLEKVKNGDFQDEFVDHVTYYVYHNSKLQKIAFNEYSIRKALKAEQSEVDEFFSLHANDELNDQLLTSLINTVNQ